MTKRRRQLIEAAEQVFATKGYAETTMADIAAEAGVTRPTVYAYFSSKYDVLSAVAAMVRDDFLTLQDTTGATPAETLNLTLRAYLSQWVRHYGILTVISHQALGDPAFARLQQEIHARTNRRHARYMQRLVDGGLADPEVSPRMLAEMVTGAAMRFAQLASTDDQLPFEVGEQLVTAHLRLLNLAPASKLASLPTTRSTSQT